MRGRWGEAGGKGENRREGESDRSACGNGDVAGIGQRVGGGAIGQTKGRETQAGWRWFEGEGGEHVAIRGKRGVSERGFTGRRGTARKSVDASCKL